MPSSLPSVTLSSRPVSTGSSENSPWNCKEALCSWTLTVSLTDTFYSMKARCETEPELLRENPSSPITSIQALEKSEPQLLRSYGTCPKQLPVRPKASMANHLRERFYRG